MTGVKAKLRVVLQADDTVVAESEDARLWQQVLLAINKGAGGDPPPFDDHRPSGAVTTAHMRRDHVAALAEAGDLVGRFAHNIGLDVSLVEGACAPSITAPYLTLDLHCWDTMKSQTAARGPDAIGAIAIAATLLALWKRAANLGNATQAEAQKVLATIDLRDPNATRTIKNSEWLQSRAGGVVVINPAKAKRAAAITRAFCTQDWSDPAWKGASAE